MNICKEIVAVVAVAWRGDLTSAGRASSLTQMFTRQMKYVYVCISRSKKMLANSLGGPREILGGHWGFCRVSSSLGVLRDPVGLLGVVVNPMIPAQDLKKFIYSTNVSFTLEPLTRDRLTLRNSTPLNYFRMQIMNIEFIELRLSSLDDCWFQWTVIGFRHICTMIWDHLAPSEILRSHMGPSNCNCKIINENMKTTTYWTIEW